MGLRQLGSWIVSLPDIRRCRRHSSVSRLFKITIRHGIELTGNADDAHIRADLWVNFSIMVKICAFDSIQDLD